MAQLIDQSVASDSAATESADANLTHPSWCDLDRCWAYENDSDNPPAGGFHESAPIAVETLNPHPISLHVQLDHGDPEATPALVVCTAEPDGVECKSLSLDQAAELYHALRVLVPGLTNDNSARTLFHLGEKNGRRAERRAINTVAQQRVSSGTLDALENIKRRLDGAEREQYRAYCLGWVDGSDGRAPEFGVTR